MKDGVIFDIIDYVGRLSGRYPRSLMKSDPRSLMKIRHDLAEKKVGVEQNVTNI